MWSMESSTRLRREEQKNNQKTYGQRSKCADLLNSYRKTSSLETFRLISQPEKNPEMKFFSEKIHGLSNKVIRKMSTKSVLSVCFSADHFDILLIFNSSFHSCFQSSRNIRNGHRRGRRFVDYLGNGIRNVDKATAYIWKFLLDIV